MNSWPILSFLPEDLAEQVVQAFVFGGAGNEALVTLQSGDVYALGFNGNGCLGIGNVSSVLEVQKVDILCQKILTDIAYGSGPHVLAITGTISVLSLLVTFLLQYFLNYLTATGHNVSKRGLHNPERQVKQNSTFGHHALRKKLG